MSKKWRKTSYRYFATRPIFKEELPKLLQAMKDDGLIALITPNGIQWYHAEYRLQKGVVREIWNLSVHQMNRVEDYIYGHDPFIKGDIDDNIYE